MELRAVNNNLIVELIEVKPSEEGKIITLNERQKAFVKYDQHPYQAKVIYAPEYCYNNGFKYKCEIKPGEIVFIRASTYESLTKEDNFFTWQDKKLYLIRVMDVVAVATPSGLLT